MNEKRLSRLIGEVDECYVEESMTVNQKRRRGVILGGGLLAVAALFFSFITADVWKEELALSNSSKSMAVYYVDESDVDREAIQASLVSMTEEELFTKWNPLVIKGEVQKIDHIELDFNGQSVYQSLVTLHVTDVYRGDVNSGEDIIIRAPYIGSGVYQTDTGVVSQAQVGVEGIFMPIRYDETFKWEQNGATLQVRDVSEYGFPDGERYLFLDTADGLVFMRDAYPSLTEAQSLNDVEVFMRERFKK